VAAGHCRGIQGGLYPLKRKAPGLEGPERQSNRHDTMNLIDPPPPATHCNAFDTKRALRRISDALSELDCLLRANISGAVAWSRWPISCECCLALRIGTVTHKSDAASKRRPPRTWFVPNPHYTGPPIELMCGHHTASGRFIPRMSS
jgi:hypothetical protein